tara:strand:+ start:200 stop:436 length:237 start_codon:yes stop_codon:yes gene_type:complete
MKCLKKCIEMDTSCPNQDCRGWIKSPSEYNCLFETIKRNGPLTLREAALRLGISFVRVKQIEDAALKKIRRIGSFKSI